MMRQIRKRDGTVVKFEPEAVTAAVHRALTAAGVKADAAAISKEAVVLLEKKFGKKIPGVEDAQEAILSTLKKRKLDRVAEEYRSYMEEKKAIRALKAKLGLPAEAKLTVNAMEVLRSRYLLKDENGKTVESPFQMFERVARAVAAADRSHGGNPDRSEREFFRVMAGLEFLPNSPTLFNAGTSLGQLSACFVLPVEDSLRSIFTTVMDAALIEQTGGGVGFSFSRLRPHGDLVRSTKGVASGPVSFMRVFDIATDVIKAGGKRRGAMMGILRVDHPDIMEFIAAKKRPGSLSNFNLSVAVTDRFMETVMSGGKYPLVNPRTGKEVAMLDAAAVWSEIIDNAWRTGDPGVVFIDEINRRNPVPQAGKIESTNPCGEQPLLPYESCNLGSINLSRMVSRGGVDWEKLRKTVHIAVHFLDNVIGVNKFPLLQTEKITLANRKIGLGVMGWAEMLIKLGIRYDSVEAVRLAERLMEFVDGEARKASEELGKRRGSFQNFAASPLAKKYSAMRNATVTTVAPTGTLSIIAGCSSGIEPLFAVAFMRRVLEGRRLFEVNPVFENLAKQEGFYSARLLERVVKGGSVRKVAGIPEKFRKLFVTAHDIAPEWHVRMQAAFQKHTDNAVSKTINFPSSAETSDVRKAFELAWRLKCKGITVYRYGSKPEQPEIIAGLEKEQEYVHAGPEYAGGCPTRTCPFPS